MRKQNRVEGNAKTGCLKYVRTCKVEIENEKLHIPYVASYKAYLVKMFYLS